MADKRSQKSRCS